MPSEVMHKVGKVIEVPVFVAIDSGKGVVDVGLEYGDVFERSCAAWQRGEQTWVVPAILTIPEEQ